MNKEGGGGETGGGRQPGDTGPRGPGEFSTCSVGRAKPTEGFPQGRRVTCLLIFKPPSCFVKKKLQRQKMSNGDQLGARATFQARWSEKVCHLRVHSGVDRTSPWIETGEEVCKERKDDS